MWRDRRPAAVIAGATPDHPGRSPDRVRRPDPAAAVVQIPSAIMEWRPTPRVIRLPIPSAIRVNPMPTITIGTPAVINRNDARLPTPADAVQLNPRAVRRKVIVKII